MSVMPIEKLISNLDNLLYEDNRCSNHTCDNLPIGSHVIPKNFLYRLSPDLKQVLMPQPKLNKVRKAQMVCNVDNNSFSIFKGFCSSCDTKIFKSIDEFDGTMTPKKAALIHYRIICYGIIHINTQLLREYHSSRQNYIDDSQVGSEKTYELIKSRQLANRLQECLEHYRTRKKLLEEMIFSENFSEIDFFESTGSLDNPLFFGRSNVFLHSDKKDEKLFSSPGYSLMPWITYMTLLSKEKNHLIFCWLELDKHLFENTKKILYGKELDKFFAALAYGVSDTFAITRTFYNKNKAIIDETMVKCRTY